MNTNGSDIPLPAHVASIEADQVVACSAHSFVLSSTGRIENPAKDWFLNTKIQSFNNRERSERINYIKKELIESCKKLDNTIQQAMERYRILNEKNDQQSIEKISMYDKSAHLIENHNQVLERYMKRCEQNVDK